MRSGLTQPRSAASSEGRVLRRRPDHPEDYGRGPFWRLAELLLLGVVFPSPPPAPRIRIDDDEDEPRA